MKTLFLGASLLLSCISVSVATERVSYKKGKIALVQYDGDKYFSNYQFNRDSLQSLAYQAIQNHANLIIFPEGALYGYASSDRTLEWCLSAGVGCKDVTQIAEPIPQGFSTFYWSEFTKKTNSYLFFNLPERGDDGLFYNTSVIVGPEGYIAKYRKRALYRTDTTYASEGKNDLILKTPFGNFGILICLDATSPGYLEAYYGRVNAIILMMDWDEMGAKAFFERRSTQAKLDIYASDVSVWDGTGKYAPHYLRARSVLPDIAVGRDGISYSDLAY